MIRPASLIPVAGQNFNVLKMGGDPMAIKQSLFAGAALLQVFALTHSAAAESVAPGNGVIVQQTADYVGLVGEDADMRFELGSVWSDELGDYVLGPVRAAGAKSAEAGLRGSATAGAAGNSDVWRSSDGLGSIQAIGRDLGGIERTQGAANHRN